MSEPVYTAVWRDWSGPRVREVRGPSCGGLLDQLNWLGGMPVVTGPNGPVTDRELMRDGRPVSIWDEMRGAGLRALYRAVGGDRLVFAGAEAEP